MSAVCPACGVAVVPGYIRCPKCRAALSGVATSTGRIPRMTDPGGTALPDRRFPFAAIAVGGGVLVAMVLLFGLRGGAKKTEAAPVAPPAPVVAQPAAPLEQHLIERNPAAAQAALAQAAAAANAPDPRIVTRALESTLRQQRLWGRVEVTGARVDVRSGSCADRAMRPVIDGKAAMLHDAGLTKLRCLEQSGAVVFERDL